jgi:hypothetical protein
LYASSASAIVCNSIRTAFFSAERRTDITVGSSMPTKSTMIPITTSISTSVNPDRSDPSRRGAKLIAHLRRPR